jgi:membrane fusion protein (multidrug efflux system)
VNRRVVAVLFVVLAAACGAKKDVAQQTKKEAPPLPSDVQGVAAAVTASETTAGANTPQASSSVASEAGGTIVATGEFVAPVRSELASRNPGRVGKMFVDEGAHVSKGQPLLEIETEYIRLNLQRAEADAARAAAAEKDASADLGRKKDLIAKESIPKATYDRSEAMFEQARAARQSAQAQAAFYRQQLADATLRSPIDGVVAEKRTDVGQRLGDNTVALVLVQTSPLKLRFRVPEKYLAQVHRGESVKATVDPYPGQVFAGKVTVVGGVIDSATRSFTVETEFANRDGKLRPGLFARVEMEPAG